MFLNFHSPIRHVSNRSKPERDEVQRAGEPLSCSRLVSDSSNVFSTSQVVLLETSEKIRSQLEQQLKGEQQRVKEMEARQREGETVCLKL